MEFKEVGTSRQSKKRVDIQGNRYGRLIALYPTNLRNAHGSVVWHCICDCGKEVDIPYNELVYCGRKSCGCKRREHETSLGKYQGRTNDTAVSLIRSTKLPSDNTTGYKGVYRVNDKYLAKIVFQKKQYHLGYYKTPEEAAAVRKHAEDTLFVRFADYYKAWSEKAEMNAMWAAVNPIHIKVEKEGLNITISMLPTLEEISGQPCERKDTIERLFERQ